ncbi:MAG: BamA/TamA family outer membrane protein, partial [Muribaculaceae bacterium]|nr:BamA/TamA family outer membrane protein [Muribaculaceae bacterium]
MDADSKGLKGWLYKHMAARPVTISRVNPDTRTDMIKTLLRNNGYFTSDATYTLNQGKNPKKASITYDVYVEEPYKIGEVSYLEVRNQLDHLIDSLARANTYLKTGNRYCLDSLNAVRIDIVNHLRNRGYYYYRPEYLQYLADSLQQQGIINLRLVETSDIPNVAERRYVTGDITAYVQPNAGGGVPDTVEARNCTLIKMEPVRIKDNVIPSNIVMRKGRPFRVGSMDITQLALSRLGIFSNIDMQVTPQDTILPTGEGVLDLDVFCTLDKPWEVKLEVQGTSKSNSFLGPGLELGMAHNNVFGGGEKLSANLKAAYEWQTGKGSNYKNGDFNSYEFGLDLSLAVPRLLAPRFVDRSRRYVNWTRFGLNASIMNRPSFFKMMQLGGSFTWEWHANKHSLNELTPFKLTYQKLLSHTDEFDSVLVNNIAVAMSFVDVFIPQMQYTYTYENDFGPNHIVWRSTAIEAGHIFSGIWDLVGRRDKKTMLGTPFSQFLKAETQLIWSRQLPWNSKLVGRVYIGAAYSTRDSLDVPYREQFYIGGANSVRAFTVRSIGPGSYHPEWGNLFDYFDQTGTFKFETNWEYRFPIFGYFNGAVFLDAGNIWLLQLDEFDELIRPEGKLRMKNFFKEL